MEDCWSCGTRRLVNLVVFTILISLAESWQQNLPPKNSVRRIQFRSNISWKQYRHGLPQNTPPRSDDGTNRIQKCTLQHQFGHHEGKSQILLESLGIELRNVFVEEKIGGWLPKLYKNRLQKNDEELVVCGTNAFRPLCKIFNLTDGTIGVKEIDGRGICPYDPLHNSNSIYAGYQLYSGTVSDFSSSDPLIYKEPISIEYLDFKQLSDPK